MNFQVRPEIMIILKKGLNQESFQPVLYGLEEEGIPFHLEEKEVKNICLESYQGAVSSSLQVGICFDDNDVMIHHKNLDENKPYMTLTRYQTRPKEQLKDFGGNAARLVKGIAFKTIE